MSPVVGLTEKRAGQRDSARVVTDEQHAAFLDVIRAVPAGRTVSINDVRHHLDAAHVPTAARGALFAAAVKLGLLGQYYTVVAGVGEVPVRVPSTGRSAHRAHVQVYQRTDST